MFYACGDTTPSKDSNQNTYCSPRAISTPTACVTLGESSEPSPQGNGAGPCMTTEGTRATHKLGALNAAIQETRLL